MNAQQYLQTMGNRISNWMNSIEFKEYLGDSPIYKFHRKGENAKTIQVPTLANRTVKLNLLDSSGNKKPTPITAKQGSLVVSKPAPEAVLISTALEVYDNELEGVVTDLSLEQEMKTLMQSLDSVITTEILKTIEGSTYKDNYIKVDTPIDITSTRLKDKAEALEEAIFMAQSNSTQFGNAMKDFSIGLSAKAYSVMEYKAKQNGFKTPSEMFNTEVFPFTNEDSSDGDNEEEYGYLIPKRHTGVSFREDQGGKVFKVSVTRIPQRQSAILEIVANAQLLIAGFMKMTVPVNGTAGTQVDVAMPLITRFGIATVTPTVS